MYDIYFKKQAEKELRKIDKQFINKIVDKIEELKEKPNPVNSRKLVDSMMSYRLRVGDYRIIYQIEEEEKIITIIHIRHRKDAYK